MSIKTNAIRIVETARIDYVLHSYPCKEALDAVTVAGKIGADIERVFKTLVTQGKSGDYYVFVVPGKEELDLKKAAASVGEKSVSMIHVKDINKITGYIRGGCSPIGMKKRFPTYFHSTATAHQTIFVSAGVRGMQIEIAPADLISFVGGVLADVATQTEQ